MKIVRVSFEFNKSDKESKLENRMQNCDIYRVNFRVTILPFCLIYYTIIINFQNCWN